MAIVNYKNVDIHIDSKIILENVSFELQEGEFAYIVGAVGSGKSTLLKIIAKTEVPYKGKVKNSKNLQKRRQ